MDSPQSANSEQQTQPAAAAASSNTATNHNNNMKNDNNIKSGVSLDACKLAKQNMAIGNNVTQKKPYVNVNTCTDTVTGNGVVVQQNGPFSIQTQPAALYINNTANRLNDSEISC